MSQLSHLHIRGFKSIEEVEIDPVNINLITGQNNRGKTSLLESIALLDDPEYVKEFEDRINKLINVNQNACSISYKYKKDQHTIYDDFKSENPGIEQSELGIRQPRKENVANYVMKTIEDVIKLNEQYPPGMAKYIEAEDLPDREKLTETVQQTLYDSLSDLSENIITSNAKDKIIIFEKDGREYPYVFLGEFYDQLKTVLIDDAIALLRGEYRIPDAPGSDTQVANPIKNMYQNMLVPRFGSGRFVEDTPPGIGGIKFKNDVRLNAESVNLQKENTAIRVNNIEKYLLQNNIVDGLVDFSFNKLVFNDEEGDPYEIPYEFMGDGFKTVVGVLWELFDENRKGNALLLEEPENHMHPGYIENLVEQLVQISKNSNVQLFITTHNRDFINSFLSKHIYEKHRSYLENEFQLVQLTNPVNRKYDYEKVRHKIEDLNLDLRGV